jgi:3-phenylpropionate/cinnamic acid dioxygenase small subunit
MQDLINALLLDKALDDFYTSYAATIDEQNLTKWPGYFTEQGSYLLTNRYNFMDNMPVYNIFCEGQGMLTDRATGIEKAVWFRERQQRRLISNIRLVSLDGNIVNAQANFFVMESRQGLPSQLLVCGESYDSFVYQHNSLLLHRRLCVIDAEILPDSIIYPL